jgi:hypothetical protein
MHIDEARRHETVRSIDDGPGLRTGQTTDRRNSIAANADVRANPWVAAPVHDTTVVNQNIERRGWLSCHERRPGRDQRGREETPENAMHRRIVGERGTGHALCTV